MEDKVKQWMESRGFSHSEVLGGIHGLLESWNQTARELAEGWPVDLQKHVENLRVRQTLQDMVVEGMLDEHQTNDLHRIDHMFLASTVPSDTFLLGEDHAKAREWERDSHWWFWRKA